MTTNFIGDKINSALFSFSQINREFVTEASDLYGFRFDSRIYINDADRGFRMDVKGREIDFILIDAKHDAEGELQYWEFRVSPADIPFNPDMIGVRAVIHND